LLKYGRGASGEYSSDGEKPEPENDLLVKLLPLALA